MQLYAGARTAGDSFEAGVKLALKAVLVSPHFLFVADDSQAAGIAEATFDAVAMPAASAMLNTNRPLASDRGSRSAATARATL